MEDKLRKNILFVKNFEPFDFTRNMGQLAVQITYTDGDTQMLTTPSTRPNCSDKGDFVSEIEFYEFIKFLQSNNIKKK